MCFNVNIGTININNMTCTMSCNDGEQSEEMSMLATISIGDLLVTAPDTMDGDISLQDPLPMGENVSQLWNITLNIFPRPSLFLISMESMKYPGYFIGAPSTQLNSKLILSNADTELNSWSTPTTLAPMFPLKNDATNLYIGLDSGVEVNSDLIQVMDDSVELQFNEIN